MYRQINNQLFSKYGTNGTNNFYSYLKNLKNKSANEILYFRRLKELEKIMKYHRLNTFFQPILKVDSGETIGYEALNRPAVTEIFPTTESFYEFVGNSNQVFLFECFCRNIILQRFIDRSKGDIHQRTKLLFINIHPNVLLDSNYHSGETRHLLSLLGIEPNQVVFELTERSAVTDFKMFEKVLTNYRSQGYRIAIDDVGSGYSSLKTIVYLKPEFIKLDKSLIQNIDQNKEQQQLVNLLIEYANQSSSEVIAEGIERLEELAFVRQQGVHYGQGYALGRPQEEVREGRIPNLVLN